MLAACAYHLLSVELRRRLLLRFVDPASDRIRDDIDRVAEAAWDGYHARRKAPHAQAAGGDFDDPRCELSVDWLESRARVVAAAEIHADKGVQRRGQGDVQGRAYGRRSSPE